MTIVTMPSAAQKRELKLRSMFVAPPGHVLIGFDLKQAESWCSAYFANEQTMKSELATGDVHSLTASYYFKEPQAAMRKDKKKRYVGKQSNHMLTYRASARRLVQTINKESDGLVTVSNKEGVFYYNTWHGLYHFKQWWDEIEAELASNGHTLVTPYGRIRVFFEAWGLEMFKQATAHLPQSTVGDHMHGAVQPELGVEGGVKLVHEKYVKTGAVKIINQGHDSILIETPVQRSNEIIPAVKQCIERPLVIRGETFTIPVEVEIGERWGELEEVKV